MYSWASVIILILLLTGAMAGIILVTRQRLRGRAGVCKQAGGGLSAQFSSLLWPDTWLVVKARSSRTVQDALRVDDPMPCSWLEGVTNADKVFIAPPVKGWIVVTGSGLPNPGNDADACFHFIKTLSRKLGRVQFFSANRISNHHAWIDARNGRILRAYAWAGTTVWNQGKLTRAEARLSLKCYDYFESPPQIPAGFPGIAAVNIKKVPLLAAQWGLDLSNLEEHSLLAEYGLAGKANQPLR